LKHRDAVLRIFSGVPELLSSSNPQTLKQFFQLVLSTGSIENQIAAITAFSSFMQHSEKNLRKHFLDFFPRLLEILNQAMQQNEESSILQCLTSLIELSEECPIGWRPILVHLGQSVLHLVDKEELEPTVRQTALELFLTVAEMAPKMVKKQPDLVSSILSATLKLITDVDDDESWSAADEDDGEEDSDDNFTAASQALDRLSIVLGGEILLPTIYAIIPGLALSQKWQDRYGALMSIAAFAEGCSEQLEASLDSVLRFQSI
jgi:hypothetical protein